MDDPIRVICEKCDGEMVVIKEKAIQRLIESSKKRQDKYYTIIQIISSAHIHKNCQNS